MKILVIGSGGREHAIVWKLRQSAIVEKIWCAPGNGGIAQHAECVPLDLKDVHAAADLAESLGADLTIVGPELPLVLGIVDEFSRRGLAILGPPQKAAQLEGSKIFSKQFMERHGIPTASIYGICDSAADARVALDKAKWPVVIKADGLCAGKGVLVTSSRSEAEEFIGRAMEQGDFGDAGGRLLLEEGLRGQELSYIVLTDGDHFIPMIPTRDHKRAFDNDAGPNTGGMGAYSTDDILAPELEKEIVDTVVAPTLRGLQADGLPYRGFLYFGLMLTPEGPKILEYNCRLGDPETEAILLRADFDLAEACLAAVRGNLAAFHAQWTPGASACVVIASEGYPNSPIVGREILGLPSASPRSDTGVVFHAGTRSENGRFYTNGGRVLVVAASGSDLRQALHKAYEVVRSIKCEGAFYRTDIGASERARELQGQAAKSTS
jgi:phosphoribosylamine--glycine ligase